MTRRLRYNASIHGSLLGRLLWCRRLGHRWDWSRAEEWRACWRCGQVEDLDWSDLASRLAHGEAIPLSANMLGRALRWQL